MFTDRVPRMLEAKGEDHVTSALDIFVKDLGIVMDEGYRSRFPLPIAAAAHQLFLQGSARGLGRKDDSSVVQYYQGGRDLMGSWEANTDADADADAGQTTIRTTVPGNAGANTTLTPVTSPLPPPTTPPTPLSTTTPTTTTTTTSTPTMANPSAVNTNQSPDMTGTDRGRPATRPLSTTLASLPAPRHLTPEEIHEARQLCQKQCLIILDDDPTGTQTMRGIRVLLAWDIPTLTKALAEAMRLPTSLPAFFIMTNARALPAPEAELLLETICINIDRATRQLVDVPSVSVILRSDSTLRGHFPLENDVTERVLGPFDLWVLCPFFLAGGRLTLDGTHYVTEGDVLVPAGQTPFAQDQSFGYVSSRLADFVEEKTGGRVPASRVVAVPLATLRYATSGGKTITTIFDDDVLSHLVPVLTHILPMSHQPLSQSYSAPKRKPVPFGPHVSTPTPTHAHPHVNRHPHPHTHIHT